MKKLYTYLSVLIVLCGTLSTQAQTCPTGRAFPYKYSDCFVYVTGTLANADIYVYNGTTLLNTSAAQTDSFGDGVAHYVCDQPITLITMVTSTGTVCKIVEPNIADVQGSSTLPIKLSSLKAQVKDNAAALQWTSSFELDSYEYVVQRSTDGKSFNDIGKVPAKGNSMQTVGYNFNDAQLGSNSVYYRLKMVDIDGSAEFSKVVYVNNRKGSNTGTLSVFPNPFRSDVQLVGVAAADVNKQNIRVYDVAGKQINFVITGSNAITVDANAPRGIYILRVKEQSFKLVKE